MNLPPPALILLLAATSIATCDRRGASGVPASEPGFAENASPAWTAGRAWKLSGRPAVIIGEEDGGAAYQFSSISMAIRRSDGTIVVGDRALGKIHFYTSSGTHIRSVGRKGDGPGDFKALEWIGHRADSVLVWDPFPSRLTVYAPDGRLARLATVRGVEMGWIIGMMSDGSLILSERSLRVDGPVGEHTDSVTYLRISTTDGRIVGKLGPYLSGETFSSRRNGMIIGDGIIFGRSGFTMPGLEGFLRGESHSFRLTVHKPDGTPIRSFGRPHEAVKASRAEISAAEAEFRADDEISKAFPIMRAAQAELFANMPHRDTLPAISRILVDDEGNVWVEEFRIHPAEEATWSVFNAAGRWLGQVVTPAGLKVMQIAGGTVIGVTKDDLGVERVLVYPIIR